MACGYCVCVCARVRDFGWSHENFMSGSRGGVRWKLVAAV